MTTSVSIGTPPIQVHLKRSARARRYSLRISNIDGKVSLTLPLRASERDAVSFAIRQEGWIRNALGKRPVVSPTAFGSSVLYEGRKILLAKGTSRSVRSTDDCILVPGNEETLPARLRGFFKVQARQRLSEASQKYAEKLKRPIGTITLRDTRSRWGSCTESGNLMFSWRLIMAPPEVLNYVAAHEVAHLVEMNHSPAFWAVVESIMPDYAAHRRWLRQNGAMLHQVQV